ncbi:MAG: GNAT family N-acetyltransferase [Planctomycetaceae bacterium]|nr:GNAT family N-acetyltransferase [Planctomycetaceae bacterium]
MDHVSSPLAFRLRTATLRECPALREPLERAFERTGAETELLRRLAEEDPRLDPSLALVAEDQGGAVLGYALCLPRTLYLFARPVRLALIGPLAVVPSARRRGVGRFLVETARAALAERSLRGAFALGAEPLFAALGFAPAFGLGYLRVLRADLGPAGSATWRGLEGRDLEPCAALYRRCYAQADGSEERLPIALDFAAAAHDSHTLVLERAGVTVAYLRFRVRETLELCECAAKDADAAREIAAFLARLLDEHGQGSAEVRLGPDHPVARLLLGRGALLMQSQLAGAATLSVVDWAGLLGDLGAHFEAVLTRHKVAACSLQLGGRDLWVQADGRGGWRVEQGGPVRGFHFAPAPHLAAGLVTGLHSFRDLWFDVPLCAGSDLSAKGEALFAELFPRRSPQWNFGPVFELADE